MVEYKDKAFQPQRRSVLLAIGGGSILALAGLLPVNVKTKETVNVVDKGEFAIVGDWVMLNQDLL